MEDEHIHSICIKSSPSMLLQVFVIKSSYIMIFSRSTVVSYESTLEEARLLLSKIKAKKMPTKFLYVHETYMHFVSET